MSRSMNRIENINNTISVKQDDTGTVVQLKIYDYDGNPVDLKNPDIDKIEVKIGAIGSGFHTIKIPTLLDETGALEFRLDVDDKVPAGTNDVEVHVYYKNGRKRIFPAEDAYKFKVSKSLDAVGKEVFKVTVDYLLEQFDNKKKEIEDEAAALREEIENAIQYVDESITEVRQEFNEQLDQTVDNKMTPFVEVVNEHFAQKATDAVRPHGMGSIASQDYEEGVFTPTLTIGDSEDGITYSFRGGRYKRFGNLCFFNMNITLASKGNNIGIVRINGLPFVYSGIGSIDFIPQYLARLKFPEESKQIITRLPNGTNSLLLQYLKDNNGSAPITENHLTDTCNIDINGIYSI